MGIYPPNRPTIPTFLHVVAVDNHGRPVKDLTADDFRITDDGKPQKIVFFRHKDSASWQVPAPLANPSSNRTRANVPYATVIPFDLLNASFPTRGVARVQLERCLESLENAEDLFIYILALEGRLYIVHGLPEDTDDIAQSGAAPWTRRIKPIMDRVMNIVTATRPVDIVDFKGRHSVQSEHYFERRC